MEPRGFAMKEVNFGSKKLWTTLFPPSFGHRQGFRSRSEPLTHEKPSSNCEAPPKEDAFKGEHRWYEDSVQVVSLVVDRQGSERGVQGRGFVVKRRRVIKKNGSTLWGLWNVGSGKLGVSQGEAKFFSLDEFQIEGLSPKKMAKVCEVLSSLNIKVYSRRKNRFSTVFETCWNWFKGLGLQEVLPRWTLDHWPIVLDTNPFKWGPTPFRFENMWLQHPSFKECFSSWWRGFQGNGWECHKFMRKLQLFKVKLKDWNKDSFGELNKRKKSILNEIANFDVVEQEGFSLLNFQLKEL
ncbi:hypothetical protein CK203_111685 [Vitis vinifera]|uniref:DUF4283 domain-containing protein n=1 Tax=Vitis vinifera TaxID=29760 RepID=A0A438FCL1_VITVI|nr:hypothetical protein CK203_111685 [Vitis vinifera]